MLAALLANLPNLNIWKSHEIVYVENDVSLAFEAPLDPDEDKWYTIDWGTKGFIPSTEIITVSSWAADAQLSVTTSSFTNSTTSVKLTGGTSPISGASYSVINTIDTLDGAVTARYQRTVKVKVKTL